MELAYCGLKCSECPVFIATINDDDELRVKTAKEWSSIYSAFLAKPLAPEDINCQGCRRNATHFVGCSVPLKKCCSEKGLDTCASCNDYGKCKILTDFF